MSDVFNGICIRSVGKNGTVLQAVQVFQTSFYGKAQGLDVHVILKLRPKIPLPLKRVGGFLDFLLNEGVARAHEK